VTGTVITALRRHAAGHYASEAGTELLISHGGLLDRPGLSRCIRHFTSITGTTPLARIDWESVQQTWHQLPLSGSERRILHIAASLCAGTGVNLSEVLTSLDDRNLTLVTTAIQHAAGRRPPPP
jgi:hypothetical protein